MHTDGQQHLPNRVAKVDEVLGQRAADPRRRRHAALADSRHIRKGGVVEKRRIVLLGATGYTGQRVLRELLARGEKPTLVGRNRTKMLAVADRFEAELPVAEVDVTSTADLTRVLEPGHVVISTVGPFMQLGMATVTAAARVGAHYLDSTGEGTFVRRVFELDAVAAGRGATLVPAFGYDYVPGNLAGALALTRAGRAGAPDRDRLLPHPVGTW